MAEPLRHRQTKEAATDMFYLKPPRHISTLPITRSAQRPSVHLSSFKPRQLRRPKEKPPEGCEAWSFQSTPADCRAWKVSSIKKERLGRSFFAFMGKDATHHRRP